MKNAQGMLGGVLTLAAVMLSIVVHAESPIVSVSDVTFRQRYPWNPKKVLARPGLFVVLG